MVSGTDLLLSNLQRTWSGDMKQGWPCLCALQGVLLIGQGALGLSGEACGGSGCCPPHTPQWHRELKQSMHMCCFMVCVCAHLLGAGV